MGDAFVPSLREYVARYQIDGRRLQPRQLLMHPGPVNRGRRAGGRGDRLAAGADRRPGCGGLVVRMAILYELLSGGAQERRRGAPYDRGAAGMNAPALRRASRDCGSPRAARRPTLLLRGARLLDPRAGSTARTTCWCATARSRRSARPARSTRPPGCELVEAEGSRSSPASSTRTSTCARPGARTRRTSSPARAPRPPAASAACSRCRTPTRSSTTRSVLRVAARARRARGARAGRLPGGDHARASPATELTEMAELAREGAAGFSDDGVPVADAAPHAPGAPVPAPCGGVLALHEEDPSLSGDGVMHEGPVSTCWAWPGSRRSPRAR